MEVHRDDFSKLGQPQGTDRKRKPLEEFTGVDLASLVDPVNDPIVRFIQIVREVLQLLLNLMRTQTTP